MLTSRDKDQGVTKTNFVGSFRVTFPDGAYVVHVDGLVARTAN